MTGAAFADTTPLALDQNGAAIFAPGTTDFSVANVKFWANPYSVSTDYFSVSGTRLLAGRAFTEADDEHAPHVAIVNERFARSLFGTANAVGRHFPTNRTTQVEIVGVVEDGKYTTLTEDPTAAVFWPMKQMPNSDTVLLVRSAHGSEAMLPAIRRAIAGVDPAIPLFSLSSWGDSLSLVTLPTRAATIVLGLLGALAMMLSVTGIFGTASYTVARRLREMGIRVALGAQGRHVLQAALGRTLLLLGIGSLAGLVLGTAASRVLASIVYQATASDPVVLIASILTMLLVGLMASAVPARRALAAEPAELLRDE